MLIPLAATARIAGLWSSIEWVGISILFVVTRSAADATKRWGLLPRSADQSGTDLPEPSVRWPEQVIQTLDAIVEPTRTQIIDAMKRCTSRNVLRDVTWHP